MDTLFMKQKELRHRISRVYANLRKKGESNINLAIIDSRLELLRRCWEQFESNHNVALELFGTQKGVGEHEYFQSDYAEACHGDYLENCDQLRIWAESMKKGERVTTEPRYGGDRSQLPRIGLPRFDGKFTEWMNFRDLFTTMVIKQPTLTGSEKLHYLKMSVHNEPQRLIQHIEIADSNFESAWKLLCDRYGNERLIIFSHLDKLLGLKPAIKESLAEIKRIYGVLVGNVDALEVLGCPVKSWDILLQYIGLRALDPQSRKDWELVHQRDDSTFNDIKEFLQRRIRGQEALAPETSSTRTMKTISHVAAAEMKKEKQRCWWCRGDHYLVSCSEFRQKSIDERKEFVRKENLCENCLGRHKLRHCLSTKSCRQCGLKHHTVIHEERPETSRTAHHGCLGRANLLGTAKVLVSGADGRRCMVRALIDSGSEVSLITEGLAQVLRLPRKAAKVSITGVGTSSPVTSRGVARVRLASRVDPQQIFEVEALVLSRLTSYQPRYSRELDDWLVGSRLRVADDELYSTRPVEIILGADIYPELMKEGLRKSPGGTVLAQNSYLGWILIGTLANSNMDKRVQILQCSVEEPVDKLLRRFWEQEEVRNPMSSYSVAEQECESHYKNTYKRERDGRYCVRLPFKQDPKLLGSTRLQATALLNHMEKRFERDEQFRRLYEEFMEEYENLGHMVEIQPSEEPRYCLPHHGVIKEASTTTKLRVVFNASAKSTSNYSLNELLHTGPQLLPRLDEMLMRWRRHRICFSADIEKMFRAIGVHEEDQLFQVIPWRRPGEKGIRFYKLRTVTYGLSCSPFLAIRTLRQLAADEQKRFPRGSMVLREDVYMDDVLSGADTVEEAKEIQIELLELAKSGHMNLRKWTSNRRELTEGLERELLAASSDRTWEPTELTLMGLRWDSRDDCFGLVVRTQEDAGALTKRRVLSKIAQLFDPLGFAVPVTVRAKIFMQRLWLRGEGWDDVLDEEETQAWKKYYEQLKTLDKLRVSRWIGYSSQEQGELHVFADASTRAYGAVAYLRTQRNGAVTTVIIAAKTKVAPLKQVSLPRLELCAAALATQLTRAIIEAWGVKPERTVLWSDSMITLSWLRSPPGRWKTYVANRVSQVQTTLPAAEWRYVPSEDNPADMASRGIDPSELRSARKWWEGPDWLRLEKSHWPTQPKILEYHEEERTEPVTVLHQYTEHQPMCLEGRYSTWRRLLRITAWCLRFVKNCRGAGTREPELLVWEMKDAKTRMIQTCQRYFSREIRALSQAKSLPTDSPLIKLSPFLDDQGVLRVGGRLEHARLGYDEKHPIILAPSSHITKLIIQATHAQTLHGGLKLTLATLRREYWIIKGRNAVKRLIHQCKVCIRYRGTTLYQKMANLPTHRVTLTRPFSHVGVDYAGPITVLERKGRGGRTVKGYICVFVCLGTKAVHLECISDCSTAAFLAGLRRFISRRGKCTSIMSDRGTNFIGAAAELRRWKTWMESQPEIRRFCADEGIEWRFNPASAPHFGGIWEAAVKSVKYHLYRTTNNARLTYEEYTTLLTQVEAILNSRPLTPLHDDPADLGALTPAHFLIGASLTSIPEPELSSISINKLNRWQRVQSMRDMFWRRWSTEYLQTLQSRSKWCQGEQQINVGDLVLIKGENTAPSQWPLARVTGLHPGSDGIVRVVDLKTATTTLRRPIVRLVMLHSQKMS